LRRHGITVLLYATARKHVPLVEANVCAGLANNIFGTPSAIDAAIACGLKQLHLDFYGQGSAPHQCDGGEQEGV
jgi:FlaA1/EpsC-like NDP-sugar epimerase